MSESELFERYLAILGVPSRPPGLEYLRELVRAQLMRVPFENVSKIYYKKTRGVRSVPSLEEHLDDIEKRNLGGTCYVTNPRFARLLGPLGFDVALCGANMSKPDEHVVCVVEVSGRRLLVDVGFGAPFFDLMDLDQTAAQAIAFGNNRFVLQPRDERGRSELVHFRDGERVFGYVVNPEPREFAHFAGMVADSYRDSAVFMNAIVVERFAPGRSLRVHNLLLTEATSDSVTRRALANREELAETLVARFGMPSDIVETAIAGVALDDDIYSQRDD